eukprot:7251121-Prymnesium_polylepis.1
MNPVSGWLAGAQSICLNFSPINGKVDLAVSLHFALFKGTVGYALKPLEMRVPTQLPSSSVDEGGTPKGASTTAAPDSSFNQREQARQTLREQELYWPPARTFLHCTTIKILSLHNFPMVRARPQLMLALRWALSTVCAPSAASGATTAIQRKPWRLSLLSVRVQRRD